MAFIAALTLLTVLPAPFTRRITSKHLGGSTAYFPLVGLLLGLILAGINRALSGLLPPLLLDSILVVSLVILTGGLHLDGFIDTCDGIASRSGPEERLRIMSQSTVGGIAVAGAICLFLLKFTALHGMSAEIKPLALVLMPVISRWTMVYAITFFPYARKDSGMGLPFKQHAGWKFFSVATLITLIISFYLLGFSGLVLLVIIWLLTWGMALYLGSRLRGLTGDTYGAINEVVEVLVLISIPLLRTVIS